MSARGFTLLELVIYMIIATALGAVAMLSYKPNETNARYQAERLRTDLRHAQMLALSLNAALRFTATAGLGGSYAVTTLGGISTGPCTTAALTDPATSAAFSVTLDPALTLAVASGANPVDFDSLGRPVTCVGNPCTCTLATASEPVTSYTVAGGSSTYTVSLSRYSGFASVTP